MFCIILWSETVNENASKERISLSLFFLFIITVEMSLTFALVGISFGMEKKWTNYGGYFFYFVIAFVKRSLYHCVSASESINDVVFYLLLRSHECWWLRVEGASSNRFWKKTPFCFQAFRKVAPEFFHFRSTEMSNAIELITSKFHSDSRKCDDFHWSVSSVTFESNQGHVPLLWMYGNRI